MRLKLVLFIFSVWVKTAMGQMPLPCLQFFEEDQITAWHGIMNINCIDLNMYENTATIADNQLRTYYVQEAGIHPGTGNGVAILPEIGSAAKFELLLEDRTDHHVEAAWFYPSNSYNVELFRKTEWGLKLPSEIQAMVDNWIHNDEHGTNLQPAINPFDPDVIDVWAEVWEPGQTEFQPVFGFFYRDFERIYEGHNPNNLPGMDDPDNWFWNEIPTEFDFRFRFAPKIDGLHFVTLHLEVEGFEPFVSDVFSFRTLAGDADRGPLKKSPNGHYYVTSSGNKVFFPVGQNISAPYLCNCNRYDILIDQSQDDVNCDACYLNNSYDVCCGLNAQNRSNHWMGGSTVKQRTLPMANYIKFNEVISDLHNNGANTFRTMPFPIAFEIEFEKLNNYNERQFMAWEFDQVLNLTDELGMRIQYNMLNHGQLGIGHHLNWDWFPYANFGGDPRDVGFCYNYADGEINIDPTSFVTSENAKAYYKKKIRYVMARFGYACNYTHMELCSEINNLGARPGDNYEPWSTINTIIEENKSYKKTPEINGAVENWHFEMANYIKVDLKQKHILLAADYTGSQPHYEILQDINDDTKDDWCADVNHDDSWALGNIDIIAFSSYNADPKGTSHKYALGQWADLICQVSTRNEIHKPVVLAETGIDDMPGALDNTFFHKNMWASAFGGYASSGMEWAQNWDSERWAMFGNLSDFMEQAFFTKEGTLNESYWFPDFTASNEFNFAQSNDNQSVLFESVLMKRISDQHQHAVGAIFNRTWNPFTTWIPQNGIPNSASNTDYFKDTFDNYILNESYNDNISYNTNNEGIGDNQPGLDNFSWQDLSAFTDIVFDNDDAIILDEMGALVNYVVRYFNPFTLANITTVTGNSSSSGRLKLSGMPTLTIQMPYVLYTVDRQDFEGMSHNTEINTLSLKVPDKGNEVYNIVVQSNGVLNWTNAQQEQNIMQADLYNMLGQHFKISVNGADLKLNDKVADGIYLLRINTQDKHEVIRILLINK